MTKKAGNTTQFLMNSFRKLFAEIQDENDRAIVIVGAANIDCLLEEILIQSLLPPLKNIKSRKNDDLFGIGRPLSTFSTKISLAFRLGIIDKEFCSSLHMIRDMRNDFAHKIKSCDLNSTPYSDKINELKTRFNIETINRMQSFYPGKTNSSQLFRVIISLVSVLLEVKLMNLPKTMKANPVSLSWIPSDA